ncbi:hypothetical protein Tco_0775652, partial [Tanacetum coccineum]
MPNRLFSGFSTWMAFGGNTRDLGLFGEEADNIMDLHQIHEDVLFTKREDGIAGIKRCRRDLSSDGVRDLGRDEKKRLDHLKQDQEMLVIKIFSERKKVFRERKKCVKIRAKRDCMMVVKENVNRLLEEVEKLEWWFEQDMMMKEKRMKKVRVVV